MMRVWITVVTLISVLLVCPLRASTLNDLQVTNSQEQAKVVLQFTERPAYAFFSLTAPERLVLDVQQSSRAISGLPLNFSGSNLIKRVRSSKAKESNTLRLVFDLQRRVQTHAITEQRDGRYILTLTMKTQAGQQAPVRVLPSWDTGSSAQPRTDSAVSSKRVTGRSITSSTKSSSPLRADNRPAAPVRTQQPASSNNATKSQVVIAIDAGHGGQDPGAIGSGGLREKQVTLAIARKLKKLLEQDPLFKPVMTRDGDYFVSVMQRSDVARSKRAHLLVSIHADAAPNRSATGASVWVLSNKRADSELGRWLEQHEKQSELLGGAGNVLANRAADPYLSKTVLDLQFGHSQRVGYDIAARVLRHLGRVSSLHKRRPEHASLGVLRSPDIPSLLVETGFISNRTEERLLDSSAHQEKIAQAVYQGIRDHFLAHPLQGNSSPPSRQASVQANDNWSTRSPTARTTAKKPIAKQVASKPAADKTKVTRHTVKRGDTLSSIAVKYGVSMAELKKVNKLKSDTAVLGQTLIIPK